MLSAPSVCAQNSLRWAFCARLATVKRLRSRLGLRWHRKRRFVRTPDGNHTLPIAPSFYVAAIKDLVTKKIVGWAMEENMRSELTSKALWMAVAQERPKPGLIHPSNRGSQYASGEYRRLIEQFGVKASISQRGNCYDNAPMEGFWVSLEDATGASPTLQNARSGACR